ncbi:hypothetical protein B0J13DRAFT_541066 [Dactylonectria estremocensis]|uniref:Zn(2)-C6 fungal-type domain-containing protein n=1 Tax=Dactylonectria estremocensis TaxID=1079267 RepID=A0A9P9JBE5_9HYPO|nr:hypothetical protein B0J13DRAFT_541066 [Dactylonectria estremocensis]
MNSLMRRACDGCRIRKVKCNGGSPCTQCAHLNLRCVLSPSSGRPKRVVRGSLVAQLRTSRGKESRIPDPVTPLPSGPRTRSSTDVAFRSGCTPRPDTASIVTQPGYSSEFFIGLVREFEAAVYPVNPIITSDELRTAISDMNDSFEDTALVYAFAAVTVNQTTTSWASRDDLAALIADLIERSLQAHRRVESVNGFVSDLSISVNSAVTCIFLGAALTAFKLFGRAFAMLREAITIMQSLDTKQASCNCPDLDATDNARRHRIHWEMYMHERFLSLVAGFPSILPALSADLALTDSTIPPYIETGFNCLVRLFCIVDDTFLTNWTSYQQGWVENKQAQLDHDEASTAEAEQALQASGQGLLTALQHADLFVTRLWLRTLVWQLALSQGLLSSRSPRNRHEGLSLHFPAQRLPGQLRDLVGRLDSVACIGAHGNGILQKLFEIISTVADVLALPLEVQTRDMATGQVEDLMISVRFLFGFRRVHKSERDHLFEKVDTLRKIYTEADFGDLSMAGLEAEGVSLEDERQDSQ